MNDPHVYDPPKWKTLDMIEPGRDSVAWVKVESLYGTPWALSRGGLTVWPELEVRMLHRRFCDAWDMPPCCCPCCMSRPMGGSGALDVV